MLNIWRLQLLVQFEALGTMQRVSEVMHISIATVSQQLSLLENETNTILFEKNGRKVHLTPSGQALVNKVRPVLDQIELIENSLHDTSNMIQGTVRIAAFTSALQAFVIPAVSKLSDIYPNLQIRLREMEPNISIPALESYQFDLAVAFHFERPPLLEQNHERGVKLGSDRLMVLVSDKNPLAKKSKVNIEDLKEENWVLEPDGAYLCEYTKRLCHDAGFEPNVINVVQSYPAMHAMIAENLAIGILPKLAVMESIKGIHVLELHPETIRNIYLVTRKAKATTRAIQIVTQALSESAGPLLI